MLTTYPAALFRGTCVMRVSSPEIVTIIIYFATIISDQLKLPQVPTHCCAYGKSIGFEDITFISLPVLPLPIPHGVLAR